VKKSEKSDKCVCDRGLMDYFLAGEDQQQINQPNDLAGG